MFLIVVIPCLNEEQTIKTVIGSIPENIDGISKKVIVVVDDGSTDNTAEIAKSVGAIVVSHIKNRGVGAAFKTGISKALELGGDIVVNMDGDGQFDPIYINQIVSPIVNKEADFVTASRFAEKKFYPSMSKIKFLGNKWMAKFISNLIKQKFYDVSCGFRAYSKEVLYRLTLFGKFTYTQETFIDLAFKGITIKEVSVKVEGRRQFGKSRVASNLFNYALQTLRIILSTYRDYKPFKLFGFAAFCSAMIGLVLGAFLMIHYIHTGQFTPHKWAGFMSGFFILVALISFLLGFILDMFSRMRMNQEELLYLLRKKN